MIGNYNMFYEQAVQAVEGLKGLWEETRAASLDGEDSKPLYLCHGDLDQHHLLMGDGYTAIIEYNRMHLGVQSTDLYERQGDALPVLYVFVSGEILEADQFLLQRQQSLDSGPQY